MNNLTNPYFINPGDSTINQDDPCQRTRLPLSWNRCAVSDAKFYHVPLPSSGSSWVYMADIPDCWSPGQVYPRLIKQLPADYVVRGCSTQLAGMLAENGAEILPVGSEAVIDLQADIFRKKSLRELVRRGTRWGTVKELERNHANLALFKKFKHVSAHGQEPQLRYLFQNQWREMLRCFVFHSLSGEWRGVITLSTNTPVCLHTELILRHPRARIGVMEALCEFIYRTLQKEGYRYWSLGEVPFYFSERVASLKSRLFRQAGRFMKFAYNFEGLFRFKNKFLPIWQPVYLCAAPRLKLSVLWDMYRQSRYAMLTTYKLKYRLSHPLPFSK